MEKLYDEDELLPLSGIQHFAFCERQWGLIHIERHWVENLYTAEGRLLHQRVDDPYFKEARGDVETVRSVPLYSKKLGVYGVADVLELFKEEYNLIRYSLIEYKRGKPKTDDRDEVQLCAQAICLEEMLDIELDYGYMFYEQIKRRKKVIFEEKLRNRVKILAQKMHEFYSKGETPPVNKGKWCPNCSMKNVCVPKLGKKKKSALNYVNTLRKEMERDL